MTSLIKHIVVLLLMFLTGCSLVSSKRTMISIFDLEHSVKNQDKVLQQYIKAAQHQLLSLEKATAGRCLNGQMFIANAIFSRAKNEYQNTLYKDAFITLTHFDRQIKKTRCILSYVEGKFGCKQTNNTFMLKHWYQEGRYEQCDVKNNIEVVPVTNKAVKELENEIIFETLHEFNSADIKPIYLASLDKVAELLNLYPESIISIVGNADSIGSNSYNHNLGKKRAQEIAGYLIDRGVIPVRITVSTNGEELIRETEHNDVDRVFNRYTLLTVKLISQRAEVEVTQGDSHD